MLSRARPRAMSSRPRVSASSRSACFPDEPRKMQGLSHHSSREQHGTVAPDKNMRQAISGCPQLDQTGIRLRFCN